MYVEKNFVNLYKQKILLIKLSLGGGGGYYLIKGITIVTLVSDMIL